ncbi:hypothetical protein nbrc107696_22680 [Gordonia spumicola]|uniref:Uncharacterized protein n=1 Tax=Gordonia spumicola TaxID=589161 RepID=A0A7I9V9A4_9ACTN|nr:hypothetical protein [Gordonia spumicola]GEE01822.1 hypothetical protein nbrc107696_22680 [Gordonia spumicola]
MSITAWASTAVVLAADQEPRGPEFGKASPLGLLIIVLLLVATFLLIRSMNRQLRKLPESFDTEHPEADQQFDEGTDTVVSDDGEPAESPVPPKDDS